MRFHQHIFFLFGCFVFLASFSYTSYAQDSPAPFINIIKTETFGLPIECEIGDSCHIMKYVDMVPNDEKMTDPACNALTTFDHKGTDFVIRDEKAMQEGVNVIAALEGTVSKIRDGEPDRWPTTEDINTVKAQRKECGNAVMIDHGNNLQTVYCHLKQGSILVKQGQKVAKGTRLAQVGLSGLTELPHLHFGIIKNQKIIDPFTGKDNNQSCGKTQHSLWDKDLQLSYQPLAIQSVGFSTTMPTLEKLSRDSYYPKKLSPDNDLLAFYVVFFGAQKGDNIKLVIRDPNDEIFSEYKIVQDKTRTRQFYFTGKRVNEAPLKEGAYTGHIQIKRTDNNGDEEIWDDYAAILVERD